MATTTFTDNVTLSAADWFNDVDYITYDGETTEILVGGGAGTRAVWTAATGTGAPVRAGSPALTGSVFIGDTANAGVTTGLTINQGAADDEILAFKSSDVAHGLVSFAETDTWCHFTKNFAANGGLALRAIAEDDVAASVVFSLQSYGGTANTSKTSSGLSLIQFVAAEHDGADALTNITADGNVFGVRAQVGGSTLTRFMVDEDGDMYSTTAGQTFDEHDDLALVNQYDVVRRDELRKNYAEFAEGYEDQLISLGILGGRVRDGGMTNVTQLQRLHNGAIRQISENLTSIGLTIKELLDDNVMVKSKLALLENKS